jgi:release factor glutamine methyltransferase
MRETRCQTVAACLRAAERALAAAGCDEARTRAEWLVAEASGIPRLALALRGEQLLDEASCARVEGWVSRVARGEPLQYVLGAASFYGREFRCDARALVPRPETEELCERLLADTELWAHPAPHIADVGTGTGCIAVTLALQRPTAIVTAIDISADALALARENARRYGVEGRIFWRNDDLLTGLPRGSLHAVVSNPPYVSDADWARLDPEIRDYEPRVALVGGADGLAIIRRLVAQARQALAPGGILWMEIGDEQGPAVRDLLADRGFESVLIHHDLAGRVRFATARRPDV